MCEVQCFFFSITNWNVGNEKKIRGLGISSNTRYDKEIREEIAGGYLAIFLPEKSRAQSIKHKADYILTGRCDVRGLLCKTMSFNQIDIYIYI